MPAGADVSDAALAARFSPVLRFAPEGREGGVIEPHRGQVWKHSVYTGEPTILLKSHLFPPSLKSIESFKDVFRLITWGVATWPGEAHQVQAGFVIPWIELPFETRGFMTLEAGLATDKSFEETGFTLSLSYYNSYFQRVSWLTTVMYTARDDILGSNFTVAAGPSFLLWTRSNKSLLGPLNVLRLSTGPNFRLSSASYGSSVAWEFKFMFRQ